MKKLPDDLVPITRSHLLSFIDNKRRPYYGPSRTEKQRERKAVFEAAEDKAVAESQRVFDIVSGWLDDASVEAVLVLQVMDLWSSIAGQKTFCKLGPTCTWQLGMASSKIYIGDLPSQRFYGNCYCPTFSFVNQWFADSDGPFPYGPFDIVKTSDGLYQAEQLVFYILDDTRSRFVMPTKPCSLSELFDVLSKAVPGEDQLLEMLRVRRKRVPTTMEVSSDEKTRD